DTQVGDDEVDHADTGQRQCALWQEFEVFGTVLLACHVLHQDDDTSHAGDEIHGAAHTLDHFSRDHPIGQIAFFRHLHGAQYGQIYLAAAYHGERFCRREKRRTRQGGDCLLARIDQVCVDFFFGRKRANSQQAVFGLQPDLDTGWYMISHQGGHAYTQVDVEAVSQFARCARSHFISIPCHVRVSSGVAHGAMFDVLGGVRVQYDAMHINAGQVNGIRIQLARFNDFFDLYNADLSSHGHIRIEVAGSLAKNQIAAAVGNVGLGQRYIRHQSPFQHILFAVELSHLFAFCHHGSDTCAGEESRNACAAGTQFFCEGSLGRELKLELASQKLPLELL